MSNEIKNLAVTIIRAKKAYYTGSAIFSDYEYDAMERRLEELDPDHPVLYAVGYDDSYDWWIRHYAQE